MMEDLFADDHRKLDRKNVSLLASRTGSDEEDPIPQSIGGGTDLDDLVADPQLEEFVQAMRATARALPRTRILTPKKPKNGHPSPRHRASRAEASRDEGDSDGGSSTDSELELDGWSVLERQCAQLDREQARLIEQVIDLGPGLVV